MIWVLRLFALFIDHNLTVFTTNYETLRVSYDALDEEVLTRALSQKHLVVTVAFQEHDLALVCADYQAAIIHPGMAGQII